MHEHVSAKRNLGEIIIFYVAKDFFLPSFCMAESGEKMNTGFYNLGEAHMQGCQKILAFRSLFWNKDWQDLNQGKCSCSLQVLWST